MAFNKREPEVLEEIKKNLDEGVAEGSICFKPLIPGLHFDDDSQAGNQMESKLENELPPQLQRPVEPES